MIEEFKYWIQNTLPAVFDDSLSLYEVMAKLKDAFNVLGNAHNDLSSLVDKKEFSDNITNLRKLSPSGDFSGTWNGVEMHTSEEGLASDWNGARGTFGSVTERLNASDLQIINHLQQILTLSFDTLSLNARDYSTYDNVNKIYNLDVDKLVNKIVELNYKCNVFFPVGTFIIHKPIPYLCSMSGAMRGNSTEGTTIKCSDDFIGNTLIEFSTEHDTSGKFINDLELNANDKGQIFKGNLNSAGNSVNLFRNIRFTGVTTDTYAVGGESSTNSADWSPYSTSGILTGSIFLGCLFDGCSKWIQAGRNQDDILIMNCRFSVTGNDNTTANYMELSGQNIKMLGCYISVNKNVALNTSNIGALFTVGVYPVSIENLFVENNGGSTNLTHIFTMETPRFQADIKHLEINFNNTPNFKAICRSQVNSVSGDYNYINIENVNCLNYNAFALLEISAINPLNKFISLHFKGVDSVQDLYYYDSNCGGTDNGSIRLNGSKKGENYSSFPVTYINKITSAKVTNDNEITLYNANGIVEKIGTFYVVINDFLFDTIGTFKTPFPNQCAQISFNINYGGGINTAYLNVNADGITKNDVMLHIRNSYTSNPISNIGISYRAIGN